MTAVSSLWLPAASTLAPAVDHLSGFLAAVCALVAGVVMVLIISFCLIFRRRPERLYYPERSSSLPIELAWTVGTIVLSLVFFAWGAKIYLASSRPPARSTTILVVAKQWFWEFQHASGVREVGQLHVPLHHPIRLLMTSEDVIHSFYVPAFRLKQDVLPLAYSVTWFEATIPGSFRLSCSEFCGAMHARMGGEIVVMKEDAYSDWEERQAPATSPVAAGRELFAQRGCVSCHRPTMGRVAPRLEGLYGSMVYLSDGSSVLADEAYLRESITDPAAKIVAGFRPVMPSYAGRFNEHELLEVVAYLKSLQGTAGDHAGAPASDEGF